MDDFGRKVHSDVDYGEGSGVSGDVPAFRKSSCSDGGHPTTVPADHRRQKAVAWPPRPQTPLCAAQGLRLLSRAPGWELWGLGIPVPRGRDVGERPWGLDVEGRVSHVKELWGIQEGKGLSRRTRVGAVGSHDLSGSPGQGGAGGQDQHGDAGG